VREGKKREEQPTIGEGKTEKTRNNGKEGKRRGKKDKGKLGPAEPPVWCYSSQPFQADRGRRLESKGAIGAIRYWVMISRPFDAQSRWFVVTTSLAELTAQRQRMSSVARKSGGQGRQVTDHLG